MKKMSKMDQISNFVGDRRADSQAFTSDKEVSTAFDDEQRKHGASQHDRLLGEHDSNRNVSDLGAGDVDVDEQEGGATGEETPGGVNSTPDQDMVDENGHALGVEYDETEPLHTTDKIDQRDQERWELDPASAEDYRERHPR